MDQPEHYVLLMRHARHERGTLTRQGEDAVRDVAGALAGWLDGRFRRSPTVTLEVLTTGAPEVRETARILAEATGDEIQRLRGEHPVFTFGTLQTRWPYRGARAEDVPRGLAGSEGDRDPRAVGPYDPDEAAVDDVVDRFSAFVEVCALVECGDAATVPVLVGNDPLIGWLAGRLSGRATSVDRGELVCLVRGRRRLVLRRRPPRPRFRWRLAWNLAVESGDQVKEITEKVRSKVATAGALGAVIVGLATFLLTDALRDSPSWWDWSALAALGASATLYFFALFHFDTLLMPSRYWGSARRGSWIRHPRRGWRGSWIRRPPSSTARVVQYWMVRIWHRLVGAATVGVGVGVLLLTVGAAWEVAEPAAASPAAGIVAGDDVRTPPAPAAGAVVGDAAAGGPPPSLLPALACVGVVAAAAGWGWSQRPRLGTSD